MLLFGQLVDQESDNLKTSWPLAVSVAVLMSLRPLFYLLSCRSRSQGHAEPADYNGTCIDSFQHGGTCMQSRATQTTLTQWSMDHAVAYSLEGVAWVSAFVCCSFYLTRFTYKTEIAAREQVLYIALLPTGRLAHRGSPIDLKSLWCRGRHAISALFLCQLACACCVYKTDGKYGHDNKLVLLLLHILFYFPVFSLQALWIGTCGELASRTSALMHHVEVLFDKGNLQERGCRNLSQSECFIYLREQMRFLHEDARELSLWWTPFALFCLVSNCFYVSYRYNDYSRAFDTSTINGMIRMLAQSLLKGDLRAAGILWPLLSSCLQIAAVELLPNHANRQLQRTFKETYAKRHAAKGTDSDDAWKDMWEMAQAHCFTFRFWALGEYSFWNIIKCKAFQELLINPKDWRTMVQKTLD